ncbi:putative poly(ADP-ribose) polymerase, catalytic domain, RST domain-containing protein [Dioscorea sansibarensis]
MEMRNVVNGWLGTSQDGINRILNDGFGIRGMPEDGVPQCFGLCLYSERSAVDSVMSSPVDVDGLRHVLFCRLILGSTEEVPPGSRQLGPSTDKFDSGVDNMQSPRKYTIWYPHVNTHILPLYILSVRVDFRPKEMQTDPVRRPTSPWMPLGALIAVLSRSLPPSQMCLIRRYHSDYMEKRISRKQLIFQIRQISGDKILISAIKSFQDKQPKAACSSATCVKNE